MSFKRGVSEVSRPQGTTPEDEKAARPSLSLAVVRVLVLVVVCPAGAMATPAPTVAATTAMVVTAPPPASTTDARDEKPEQDQLEDAATGKADPEGGETFDIPA